ncbi:hypothetical protein [Cohnella faecalis]|uniref:hypothetical protein n=1 Tax=Cohnella faecalis TaxID=2315694 RepID=UPI0011C21D53|nr:hypothetical protein [Cohnella faecalis]
MAWDPNTLSVDVKLPNNSTHTTNDEIALLKFKMKVANTYRIIYQFGAEIQSLTGYFDKTLNAIQINQLPEENLMETEYTIHALTQFCADLKEVKLPIIEEAKKYALDLSDMKDFLDEYYKALNYYSEAYTLLNGYYKTGSKKDLEDKQTALNKAGEVARMPYQYATAKYYDYYNATQK